MTSYRNTPIAYYGGTFDPIHLGHINVCKSIASLFKLPKVFIMPNHIPPHRDQPIASPEQRITMIKLAIADEPLLALDIRELVRATYSYTIDTLIEIRKEISELPPLFFIIGEDSLYSLNRWHQWEKLLDYCHLIVCKRNQVTLSHHDDVFLKWINDRTTKDIDELLNYPQGKIFLADTPYYDISATEIRHAIKEKIGCHNFLNSAVHQFILQESLYLS